MDYEFLNERDAHHLTDSFTVKRYRQMMKFSPKFPERVLDIGIGSGLGGEVVKEFFPETQLVGIDAVESRTSLKAGVYSEVNYGSILDSKFVDESFDLILAAELIEHIGVRDIERFIHEVYRLLKPSGIFILTTPNPNDIKLKIRSGSVLGGSHVSQHFIRETKQRLRLNSFRVKKCYGTGKSSLYVGHRLPKCIYGSYMLVSGKS